MLAQSPKPEAHYKVLTITQIELEFGILFFFRREGKTGVPGEKHIGARKRTTNKLNTHMPPGEVIELGWEESALNTAPSLL